MSVLHHRGVVTLHWQPEFSRSNIMTKGASKQQSPAPKVRLDGGAPTEDFGEEPNAPDLQQLVGKQDRQEAQIEMLQAGITEARQLMEQLLKKTGDSSASSPVVAALPRRLGSGP